MRVYTIQLSQWRKLKDTEVSVINTTVKSGIKAFAPSWDIVMGVKSESITPEEYTEVYLALLETSWENEPEVWNSLLEYEAIAFSCYCPKGTFCHRHLLAEFYQQKCDGSDSPVILLGEVE